MPSAGAVADDDESNSVVKEVWNTAFPEFSSQSGSMDTPYYEIWGDPMAPVQLASLFNRHGVNLTMDDIVENPTMRLQVQRIGKKL